MLSHDPDLPGRVPPLFRQSIPPYPTVKGPRSETRRDYCCGWASWLSWQHRRSHHRRGEYLCIQRRLWREPRAPARSEERRHAHRHSFQSRSCCLPGPDLVGELSGRNECSRNKSKAANPPFLDSLNVPFSPVFIISFCSLCSLCFFPYSHHIHFSSSLTFLQCEHSARTLGC